MEEFYRFCLSSGFVTHVWKSVTRQDHKNLRAAVSKYLPADGVAIDVGAHGGQVARLLAGIARDGFVVAVEPSGYARAVLRLALWLRACRNVVVVAAALGATAGAAVIRTPIKRRGDMGYGLANMVDGGAHSVAEPVAMLTLDSLVAALALTRVDFIKADIEGFEAELIKGAAETLQNHRPAVYLEMDEGFLRRAGGSLAGLWRDLMSIGYAGYEIRPDGTLLEINAPRAGDVLWLPGQQASSDVSLP